MYIRNSTQNLIYNENNASVYLGVYILLNVQELCKENHKTLLMNVKKDLDRKII